MADKSSRTELCFFPSRRRRIFQATPPLLPSLVTILGVVSCYVKNVTISSFAAAMFGFPLVTSAVNRRSTGEGGRGLSEAGQQVLAEDHHALES